MPEPHSGVSYTARASRRASREKDRAQRAAQVAARHEQLAVRASPTLRGLHLDMAEMHRAIERRHLAAAEMNAHHAARLAAWHGTSAEPRFITAVASALGVEHVGVSLLLGNREEAVNVGSDGVATAAQEVEFTLGEGPVHDVAEARAAVAVDETALPSRWPEFASQVAEFGVHAVAAAPLRTATGCLGVLTVFDPPAESARSAAMLATVADALVHSSLLAPDSADPLDLPVLVGANHHAVVHQASGIVAEQLGCRAEDALVVLRARAFAMDEPLAAIAAEVVHRGLRLDR
ncbi:ANTAR domain-containing protein [Actinophytocola sp. NPDC049390]|uniref:ANTAR domain-containing protein n=1 Tax=Actinophytocola sp. NPDC049390 TaxID=3363894 RepID=UPI00379A3ECB